MIKQKSFDNDRWQMPRWTKIDDKKTNALLEHLFLTVGCQIQKKWKINKFQTSKSVQIQMIIEI